MGKPALSTTHDNHAEELTYRRGGFDMRMVVNRSFGLMRIMDYRSGNHDKKRELLDHAAKTQGLRKIFTVVEKQDSANWRAVGFTQEAAYPCFFRTADAYMMSRCYDEHGQPVAIRTLNAASAEAPSFSARKLRKPDGLAIEPIDREADRVELLDGTTPRTLPFSRVKAPDLVLRGSAGRTPAIYACAEVDESFAHANVEFVSPPDTAGQLVVAAYTGQQLLATLKGQDVNNVFAITPIEDKFYNELCAGLGFNVIGRLNRHVQYRGRYADCFLWHLLLNTQRR
ncbi:MAG: hypothetical protein H6707_12700 [Deltaproteobacteria bacterium]|nr:hypothetical protein [Deltaproteobacteria bacterium]